MLIASLCPREVKERRDRVEWVEMHVRGFVTEARVKGKIYKMVVKPAMMYDVEMVALTKSQEAEVAELEMLRFYWEEGQD